jgi:transcriptional regulator with XRE-family HTH domain
MDTKKIGKFLKELRNEKNMTQEQLAERMFVSGRTVSRWETGANLPDIAILL